MINDAIKPSTSKGKTELNTTTILDSPLCL